VRMIEGLVALELSDVPVDSVLSDEVNNCQMTAVRREMSSTLKSLSGVPVFSLSRRPSERLPPAVRCFTWQEPDG
jgi:hypothetical protein